MLSHKKEKKMVFLKVELQSRFAESPKNTPNLTDIITMEQSLLLLLMRL